MRQGSGKKTKHIELKHLFIQDLVKHKVITMHTVPTANNPADCMTKTMDRQTLDRHWTALGLSVDKSTSQSVNMITCTGPTEGTSAQNKAQAQHIGQTTEAMKLWGPPEEQVKSGTSRDEVLVMAMQMEDNLCMFGKFEKMTPIQTFRELYNTDKEYIQWVRDHWESFKKAAGKDFVRYCILCDYLENKK